MLDWLDTLTPNNQQQYKVLVVYVELGVDNDLGFFYTILEIWIEIHYIF